ncbi:MAG: Gfo/Idh/MocA family oxidoreductase [Negativicutes bacterium]|jgi:predicted dehydrogenase
MIKIAIIGTGGMAGSHAEHLQKIRGVKITACADMDIRRAETFAKKFGIKKFYGDYKEMLDNEKLEGVTNVTSDRAHYPVAMEILKRKINLLSEKPLAETLEQAVEMRDLAVKSDVVNMVNFSYRNSSGLQKAAEIIRSGVLGQVLHVEASYLQSWLKSKAWGDWHDADWMLWRLSSDQGGAGALGDIGCHIFDLTCLLTNEKIVDISTRLYTHSKDREPGYEVCGKKYALDCNNSFVSHVEFGGGGVGVIHVSHGCIGQSNSLRCRVYCSKGAIEIDLDKAYDEYRICSGKNIDKNIWKTVKCKRTPNNYERFVKAIKTNSRSEDGNDFANGCAIQGYLHYSFLSAAEKKPEKIVL